MKVILLQDVPKVGKKYDIREVSDGYGRNFLLRNKLAEAATDKSLKVAEEMKQKMVAVRKMADAETESSLAKISNIKLTLKGRANEEGHLFAGIKSEEISRAIKDQADLVVLPEFIMIDKPIKTLGEHTIGVSLAGKTASFKLVVDKE